MTIGVQGQWKVYLDYEDLYEKKEGFKNLLDGVEIKLPGSLNENKIGDKPEFEYAMTKEGIRSLRQDKKYIGAAWYERTIDVPEEFLNKELFLSFERIMLKSSLWIDGKFVGDYDSVSTPHIYNITTYIKKGGKHRITVKIDNRDIYELGKVASGFTDDTQTIWNGIIGKMELVSREKIYLKQIQVYPDIKKQQVKILSTVVSTFEDEKTADILYDISDEKVTSQVKLKHGENILENIITLNAELKYWDEFTPTLYNARVVVKYNGVEDEKTVKFGMREIRCEGKKILLNDKQIFMRGTLDCCYFPLTGYPNMDHESWVKTFKVAKQYGINHIRFHSWCPPEEAFIAADELGIYVLAENIIWLNDDKDVCHMAVGDCQEHYDYIPKEAERIIDTYGNHPSFMMFSNGNELRGDFELLENIIIKLKNKDKRHIYTLTTNFMRDLSKSDDYYCANNAPSGDVLRSGKRMHRIIKDNRFDYSTGVNSTPVPCISHEIGQYCVYPDMSEIDKYTGCLRPSNLCIIRDDLLKKGLFDKAESYKNASGKLALLMYKEEIEAALRTRDFGGFELLGLNDYQGQCTATVGILNEFWETKGLVEPEEFRQFCSETVPLLTMAKRIYYNDETFVAEASLFDFGKAKLNNPEFCFALEGEDGFNLPCQVTGKKICVDLSVIKKAMKLKAVLSIKNTSIKNTWDIWVYPKKLDSQLDKEIYVTHQLDEETQKRLKNGESVLILANENTLAKSGKTKFVPVFWSPAFFISDNICGGLLQQKHDLFKEFPTDYFMNYQWQDIIENSDLMYIDGLNVSSIFEPVPNFFNNASLSVMFEAFVEKGKVFVCSANLEVEDSISVKELKNAIYNYVSSKEFLPNNRVSIEELKKIFK